MRWQKGTQAHIQASRFKEALWGPVLCRCWMPWWHYRTTGSFLCNRFRGAGL